MRSSDLSGLLSWVAGPLGTVGGDDGEPPRVGRELPLGRFVRPHQSRCHVRDAVDVTGVEGPVRRFRVPEDVVVLAGPAVLGPARHSRKPK